MPEKTSTGSRFVSLAGLALAGAGVAHFVKPEAFDEITGQAFPSDTRTHVYIDGAAETAIGLALAVPKTRKLAVVGLIGYGAYLGVNIARNR
ncbi:hypothetical protein A5651_20865 [Mycobacterium sp. 1274761.0]|nr:hypothetical protein A5651_20865 [Mycobacterium sp. 1274761.0]